MRNDNSLQMLGFVDGNVIWRDGRYHPQVIYTVQKDREPAQDVTRAIKQHPVLQHVIDRAFQHDQRIVDVSVILEEALRRQEGSVRAENLFTDRNILAWTIRMTKLAIGQDPEPWVWAGQRFETADPAGQDFDFSPEYKPRDLDELEALLRREID